MPLIDDVQAEQNAISAGTATGCNHVCSWDATLTCLRATHAADVVHVGQQTVTDPQTQQTSTVYVQWQE